MTDGEEFIDIREQLKLYVDGGNYKYLVITLVSGDKYVVTGKFDILILQRVVFVFQASGVESCFLFDTICSVDVIRRRET